MTSVENRIFERAKAVLAKILSPEAASKIANEIALTAAPDVLQEIQNALSAPQSKRGRRPATPAGIAGEES